MNKDIFEGKWKQLRGAIQKQWGRLTNDDLDQVAGDANKLLGLVQQKYGYARDEAERLLREIVARAQPVSKPYPAGSHAS